MTTKRALHIVSLILLAAAIAAQPQPAHAQFWKKIFGKEEEKRPVRKPVQKPAGDKKNTSTASKKKAPEPPKLSKTVMKPRYRVEVLTPLYLNELVSGGKPVYKSHLPDKVLPGLSFYQGIQLAADTLRSSGYHLDVYVHDITDPAHTVDALLKGGKLDTADLIIGAVQSSQVAPLAALAQRRNINFVSTLTPADGGVKGNLYFNLAQPTLQRHCAAVKAAVARRARPTVPLLIYQRSTVPLDAQCFRYITQDSSFAYTKVAMNTPLPSEKLRNFLDSSFTNIIVMPIVDVTYATQLLQQLGKAFPKYNFEVYGMPSWKSLSFLRKEGALPNVGIIIPSPFYFDPSTSAGKGFSDAFNEKYGGRPGDMAYRSYETLSWYAYLLQRYGTVFNEHYADNGGALFTRFDMKPAQGKDGITQYWENGHVYLYHYQGGSFSVEQ